MRVTCDRCPTVLFTVGYTAEGYTGVVETKCPRCHTVTTRRYQTATEPTMDIRCDNSFKGRDLGGWCGQLICRISADSHGDLGYRCPRCKHEKIVKIRQPAEVKGQQ